MANSTFTLDSIREAAEEKYGATKIDLGVQGVVELRNMIRLSKEERQAFKELKFVKDEDDDTENDIDEQELFDRLADVVVLLVGNPERSGALLNAIGVDRVDLLSEIVSKYMEDQSAGKASASQD